MISRPGGGADGDRPAVAAPASDFVSDGWSRSLFRGRNIGAVTSHGRDRAQCPDRLIPCLIKLFMNTSTRSQRLRHRSCTAVSQPNQMAAVDIP